MKVYNLTCEHDHPFEGWFSSEDEFKAQSSNSLIRCPMCDSSAVTRLPSAPRLSLSTSQSSLPDIRTQAQAQLMEVFRTIVLNTEDVGSRFAEEARRIHYREAPERPIRGVASAAECDALTDEGIDVVAFPVPEAFKRPLQ